MYLRIKNNDQKTSEIGKKVYSFWCFRWWKDLGTIKFIPRCSERNKSVDKSGYHSFWKEAKPYGNSASQCLNIFKTWSLKQLLLNRCLVHNKLSNYLIKIIYAVF